MDNNQKRKTSDRFLDPFKSMGDKLKGSFRSMPPAGGEGRARATSAPPPTDRPLDVTTKTGEAQAPTSSVVTVSAATHPSVQMQTVDSTSPSASSHSPKEHSGLPQTSQQKNEKHDDVEDIIKELQSAKAAFEERQAKDSKRHTERIARILKRVQSYAAIVDVGIQHSPETTALVWGGVRFILQVALNYVELMENLELAMTTIIERMATCEFYAHIYVNAPLGVKLHSELTTKAFKDKMDSALKAFYAAILAFTREVQQYFDNSASLSRMVGNLFIPFSISMQPFLDDLASKEKVVRELADGATMKRVMENSVKLEKLEDLLSNMRKELKILSRLDEISATGKENLAVVMEIKDMVTELVLDQRQTTVWKTISSEIQQLKKDYIAKNLPEAFEFDLYIPAEGMTHPHDSKRFDLLEAVQIFLSDAMPQKVCLIQGTAGSGKSTFNHHLARYLWSEYDRASNQESAVVPLFISLFRVYTPGAPNRDLIAAFLAKKGLRDDQIDLLRHQRQFVFILDGYDEIERRDRNFYTENELDLWNAKVVITSRPEYLPAGYQSKFYPPSQSQLFQEYFLAPFSKSSIRQYISQYLKAIPGRSVEEYEHYIARPDVSTLISNPFLLKMMMTVRPAQSKDKLKRVDLYEQFIDDWLKRAHIRLNNIQLPETQRNAYTQLEENNFSLQARHFCQQFALALYHHQVLEATYAPIPIFSDSTLHNQSVWRKFLANDNEVRILRLSSPLIRQGNTYRFLHKSLRDYLVAEVLWQDESLKKCTANAHINKFHLVDDPGVLDFIVEKAWLLQDQLLALIERSKSSATFSTAAANAMTILVKAGRSFSGHNLRGIQIPRADLSGGFFDGAQLQNADLCGIRMHQTWLEKADLSKASMNNVSFGERPFMQSPVPPNTCAFSPDGQLLASGGSNCTIHLLRRW